MDFQEIRRVVITAVFSDDILFDKLVLKGGNALNIVHQVGVRTSLDIDLSIEGDFVNVDDAKRRLIKALEDRFDSAGYVVFDSRFLKKPPVPKEGHPDWGGYLIEFKIMEKQRYELLSVNQDALRRMATPVGPGHNRVFHIEISKHEYCKGKIEAEVKAHKIFVYSLPMIVVEKLRAICQQMSEYTLRHPKTARARDFLDIYSVLTQGDVELSSAENQELIRGMFAAKSVPLMLLGKMEKYREFHRADWDAVTVAAGVGLEDYDFYFDYVLKKVKELESLWVV
ncbi:MAG: nucleotidyl transferase AbiEii/AbiGii toxin family protein [Verrucomicrobiia bacterium]|jgi:hypothetical protein